MHKNDDAVSFGKRAPLSWRIEMLGTVPTVMWSNGARRPAGELELELWRDREALLKFIESWSIAGTARVILATGRVPACEGPPATVPPPLRGVAAAGSGEAEPLATAVPAPASPAPLLAPRVNAPAPPDTQRALAAFLREKHRDKLLALRRQRQANGAG
jgi:hypothetical protein